MPNYCGVCGEKMISFEIKGYDKKTGKRARHYICSSKKCGHDGVGHDMQREKAGAFWWMSLFYKCRRCGLVENWD